MHLRHLIAALSMVVGAAPAAADIEQVEAEGTVDDVMKRLESAVVTAGATVFARVDHGAGADSVGTPIGASQLLIFGSPNLGTPAIVDDPLAGLVLPLKVLVYADGEGQTRIAYEEVETMFDDLSIDDDAEYVETMERVLGGFIETAASE
jgi:uncharacterized protein (DUF302 family)